MENGLTFEQAKQLMLENIDVQQHDFAAAIFEAGAKVVLTARDQPEILESLAKELGVEKK